MNNVYINFVMQSNCDRITRKVFNRYSVNAVEDFMQQVLQYANVLHWKYLLLETALSSL